MKIPTFLYETLLEQKDEKSLHVENCNAIWVCFNWSAYLTDLTIQTNSNLSWQFQSCVDLSIG